MAEVELDTQKFLLRAHSLDQKSSASDTFEELFAHFLVPAGSIPHAAQFSVHEG